MLKCDGKALIDLLDGLSSGSVVLVGVTNGDLADHDPRLEGRAAECLPSYDDHVQTLTATLLIVVGVLLDDGNLGSDQTLSHRTIDEIYLILSEC